MAVLALDVRDYLDGFALADLSLRARLRAVREWKQQTPDPEPVEPDPSAPLGDGIVMARRVPGTGFSWETWKEIVDLGAQTSSTDAAGWVEFEWPYTPPTAGSQGSPLWEAIYQLRLQRAGQSGVSVYVEYRVSVVVGGVVLGGRIQERRFPRTAQPDETTTGEVLVDLAETIVGHTTETDVTLWFRSHLLGLPADARYVCDIHSASRAGPSGAGPIRAPLVSRPVVFDQGLANTAVVGVSGLDTGAAFDYGLYLELPARAHGATVRRTRLTGGSFRTAAAMTDVLRVAFASCHDPGPLDRWEQLDLWRPDLTLLIGDQIYAGGFPTSASSQQVFDRYVDIYETFWRYRQVRNVLRRQPTYMMLDDHEIADDWGTTFTLDSSDPVVQRRIREGLRAYFAFQHSHNPGANAADLFTAPLDYSFERGQVAFYCLDARTQRGRQGGYPVLGREQREQRLRQWARSAEAEAADVVVVVAPVPLAFGDVERAEELFKGGASLVGGAAGGLLAGPAGFIVGGLADLGEYLLEEETGFRIDDRGRVVEPDLADQWSYPENRPDLAAVLDILFDLQNDVAHGGRHPRAVVVLGGDTHAGAIHRITSESRRHADNPTIYQFTSSPISREPTWAIGLLQMVGKFDPGLLHAATAPEALISALLDDDFYLCDGYGGAYRARFEIAPLNEHNFGTLLITRTSPSQRVYEVIGAIRGTEHELRHSLVYDLDNGGPPEGIWRAPAPERLRPHGRPAKYVDKPQVMGVSAKPENSSSPDPDLTSV